MIVASAVLAIMAASQAPADTLTDDAVRALLTEHREHFIPSIRVAGIYHGLPLLVQYRCAQVCEGSVARVVYYDIEPGPHCTEIGGKTQAIPNAGAAIVDIQKYCVPAILMDHR